MKAVDSLFLATLDGLWFGAVIWLIVRLMPSLSPRVESALWRLVPVKLLLAFFGLGFAGWQVGQAGASGGQSGPLSFALVALLTAWTLGAAVTILQLAIEAWQVRRLISQPALSPDWDWWEDLAWAAECVGLKRTPALRVAQGIDRPMIAGTFRPVILLPEDMVETSDAHERRAILIHECAHAAHGDLGWSWLFVAARVVFFFHPMLWLASSRCGVSQERACDLAAVEQGGLSRSAYATWLVKMSTSKSEGSTWSLAAGGSFKRLKERIESLTPARFSASAMLTACLAAGLAMAPLTVRRAAPVSQPVPNQTEEPARQYLQTVEPLQQSFQSGSSSAVPHQTDRPIK